MEREQLFIETMNDLKVRSSSTRTYDAIQAAGLIRRLILDKHSLVDKLARKYSFKETYHVGRSSTPLDFMQPVIATMADGVDPETNHTGQSIALGRADFLRHPVAYVQPNMYSVKHFIRFGAHVLGGVHAGDPESQEEQLLLSFNHQFNIGGEQGCIRTLRAIARVAYRALEPLGATIVEGGDLHGNSG